MANGLEMAGGSLLWCRCLLAAGMGDREECQRKNKYPGQSAHGVLFLESHFKRRREIHRKEREGRKEC